MTVQAAIAPAPAATPDSAQQQARHARLFELIRQSNIAAMHKRNAARAAQPDARPEIASSASKTLLPQEKHALGISESFGR